MLTAHLLSNSIQSMMKMLLKELQTLQQELVEQDNIKKDLLQSVEVAMVDVGGLDQAAEVAPVAHRDLLHLHGDHIQVLQADPKVLEMVTLEQILVMVRRVDTQEEIPGVLILSLLIMKLNMRKRMSMICKCLTTQRMRKAQ